jgi:cyclophilin family peptidyl-prolyl cis-trans isomerase/HEAT repeat protein
MKTFLVVAAVAFLSQAARTQTSQEERDRIRREKIESILRLQDLRTPFDGRLTALLSDSNPAVRRRATLACGSLQDTSVIGLLTRALTDPDSATDFAAAFALGQTGTRLSERGRQSLEYDLIWKRLQGTPAAGRLIEEIGKFGTASGLNDLMVFVANAPPVRYTENLIMSVARFAIRGITSPDAVKFLLRYVQPGVPTPWQAVYALQRTGDNAETRASIELLRLLERHGDPLVRMNLATLMGKLHDAGGPADLLQRMADRDTDWRVRVNALKALGQFSWRGHAGVIATFRRAFFDRNLHIGITALSVFPAIGVDAHDTSAEGIETMRQIAYIADNTSGGFSWQLQAEAASSLAKIERRIPHVLLSGRGFVRTKLRARLIRAGGESGDPAAEDLLTGAAAEDDPLIVCAALDGFRALALRSPENRPLADTVSVAAVRSLGMHDMSIVSTAAGILGDSLFRRNASVTPLLNALRDLRPPGDTETMQDVIGALGELRDSRASGPLIDLLQSMDQTVAQAAAQALRRITGNDYSERIVRNAEPVTTDMDFAFLRALPHVVRVKLETSRGDILIELDREGAPFTTMSIVKLSQQRGFYRGLTFHRVVPNFVVQGGDPRGDGWGGPGYSLRSEFSMEPFGTGTVGIASAGKDTEGSQFFITHSPQPHLDGRYTVTGRVVKGMNIVDELQVDDRIYDILILH